MQTRHKDRKQYFEEQAGTAREFYIKYVERFHEVSAGGRVLEIGCGEGGNLLPFAERGCKVEGVDLSLTRIRQAEEFFREAGYACRFTCRDFCATDFRSDADKYDVIFVHDVIEHIPQALKERFLKNVRCSLAADGIAFFGFPAWQMPFGGHQQICRHRLSKIPWIHLLPAGFYEWLLRRSGESEDNVRELMSIREAATSIERFEGLCHTALLHIADRRLWLVNPHYLRKFGLKPRRVNSLLASIPYVRNFYTTGCFYLVKKK